MAPTSAGLINGGITSNRHYQFQYDDSLSPPKNPTGPEPARTNAVMAACENDFNLMSGWFANKLEPEQWEPDRHGVTQNSGGGS